MTPTNKPTEPHEHSETKEEILEKMEDPKYLPSMEELEIAFPKVKDGTEMLSYCLKHKIWELWNKEHIEAMGNYIIARAQDLGATSENPLKVLEVAAGDGRLTYFLKDQIAQKASGLVQIIATDDYSDERNTKLDVEKLDCKEALKVYNPDIVLCSWMRSDFGWSSAFRNTPNVKEYILIGEAGGGCCGSDWETWGKFYSSPDEDAPGELKRKYEFERGITPFNREGFEEAELLWMHKYHACRYDTEDRTRKSNSSTHSFRRRANAESERQEILEKMQDPRYLPTKREVLFGLPSDDAIKAYCNEQECIEIWTQEYIEYLANYLITQAEQLGKNPKKPLKILEVGAMDGRLAFFLKQYLDQAFPGLVEIHTTDTYEEDMKNERLDVEKLDHKKALKKYKPDIVLQSWMPKDQDFSHDFRKAKSVQQYILIGEPKACGDSRLTWGGIDINPTGDINTELPFEKEGFYSSGILLDAQKHQICVTCGYEDTTFTFSRREKRSIRSILFGH